MLIQVTADDIREGEVYDCDLCPVARAMSRALDRPVAVFADEYRIGDERFHLLPPAAELFVQLYDGGEAVGPFEFEIPDPEGASCAST